MNTKPVPQNLSQGELAGPNCWQCRHFAISWERATPYMCNLMGFKSRLLPSIEVLRADSQSCRGFALKASTPGQHPSRSAQVSNTLSPQTVTQSSKTVWSA